MLFAGFVFAKIVTYGEADFLQRFFPNARDLFQLLRGHVGQRFDRGDAGNHQLLDDLLAQLGHLFDGGGRAAAHRLHLLLDFLALLFLALDVDLPAQQLGRQTHILALLADGQGELGVVYDDLDLLLPQVCNAHAAHLGRLQSLLGKGGDLLAELDDVDLLAPQFANDGLYAHALHAHAGAHRIDILVPRQHGDLGALHGFAGNDPDNHRVV